MGVGTGWVKGGIWPPLPPVMAFAPLPRVLMLLLNQAADNITEFCSFALHARDVQII